MTRKTIELKSAFKKTAQRALKNEFGFEPNLSDIEVFDGNGRSKFKIRVRDREYQFDSFETGHSKISPDGVTVWVGPGTIKKLK
jgi:hypothetical protein